MYHARLVTTGNIFQLNNSPEYLPNKETIEEIAIELGVDPSFIEKDWYAVKVIQIISGIIPHNITPIFSGGTSLSKGYGLLKRFSEDLDFRARFKHGLAPGRAERRAFKESIFTAIESIDGITFDEAKVEAGSNYFKMPLFYPQQFHIPNALRPSLQLEFSYTQPRSDAVNCSIHSFVAEFTKSDPETNILCLTPHETASDKLSALVWRVTKRNRQDKNDDPAMIRHLHDLCKLQTEIRDDESAFIELALTAFDVDMNTGKRQLDKNLYQAALGALAILHEDSEYNGEYQRFVSSMSYADDSENIEFDEALSQFEDIVGMFK